MDTQVSVEQILNKASQLGARDFEHLFANLNLLRARRTAPSLSKNETALLQKVNEGFSSEKWARIAQLDEKMEFSELTGAEADEHLALAEELEAYTVQRYLWLKQLATLRKVSVEQMMEDLDISPR